MATSEQVIELKGVAKTYAGPFGLGKKVHALRGIDMTVGRGEVFGLLGPNGAGKSTLVKILMRVIRPSACSGHVLGAPVGHTQTLARVGYLPEHHKFPEYLTGAQVLDYFASLSDVPKAVRRKRAGELLDLVGISRWAGFKVKGYSKGMRQRLGVAQALMNDPDIVFLDEPTDGVDPVGRRDIRNILLHVKQRGKTVFLNSHLLSELEMVCDRVAILVQGVVASQGSIDDLTRDQKRYEIEVSDAAGAEAALSASSAITAQGPAGASGPPGATEPEKGTGREIGMLPSGVPIRIAGGQITIGSSEATDAQPIIDALRAGGVQIVSVRPVRPSLEDLFMQAVTDPSTGEALKPGASETPLVKGAH